MLLLREGKQRKEGGLVVEVLQLHQGSPEVLFFHNGTTINAPSTVYLSCCLCFWAFAMTAFQTKTGGR